MEEIPKRIAKLEEKVISPQKEKETVEREESERNAMIIKLAGALKREKTERLESYSMSEKKGREVPKQILKSLEKRVEKIERVEKKFLKGRWDNKEVLKILKFILEKGAKNSERDFKNELMVGKNIEREIKISGEKKEEDPRWQEHQKNIERIRKEIEEKRREKQSFITAMSEGTELSEIEIKEILSKKKRSKKEGKTEEVEK